MDSGAGQRHAPANIGWHILLSLSGVVFDAVIGEHREVLSLRRELLDMADRASEAHRAGTEERTGPL